MNILPMRCPRYIQPNYGIRKEVGEMPELRLKLAISNSEEFCYAPEIGVAKD